MIFISPRRPPTIRWHLKRILLIGEGSGWGAASLSFLGMGEVGKGQGEGVFNRVVGKGLKLFQKKGMEAGKMGKILLTSSVTYIIIMFA